MHRVILKYAIDLGLLVSFILCFVTGVLKFPSVLHLIWGGGRLNVLEPLTVIHDFSGIILGVLVLAHLVMSYRWIVVMTRKFLGSGRKPA